jgi:twinkle protein
LCNSRDNLARYDDGHAVCFGCGHYVHGDGTPTTRRHRSVSIPLRDGEYAPLVKRGLSEETLRKFDYRLDVAGRAHYATYYDEAGVPVAQKERKPGKAFAWIGEPKKAALFGQQVWRTAGRKVVVTEGEIDAMSLAQVQGLKWPVVSVPNGAQGATTAIKKNLEWLESFDQVVFMFDMDDPGRVAAKECAELLTPGKAHIAELPRKDANEMLVAGEEKKLIDAMWSAKVYRPDGIVAGVDLWETIIADDPTASVLYPWVGLNELTHGLRTSELVTFCAGTGVGKSTACREVAHWLLKAGETVGYVALEESVKRTALGIMSIEMNQVLHVERASEEEMRAAYDATVGSGRVFLYDHWGSLEHDNLLSKIRAMVRTFGCRWVVLDHISIVISGQEQGDERRMIDNAMTMMRSLAQELDIGILVVSHLRKGQGVPFEEGGEISLADLRGSAAIAQLSDIVIGLERNQQDEEHKNVAKMRVLKNRFTGETGVAGFLRYDYSTGRLGDCDDPFKEDTSSGDTEPEF